MARSEAVNQLLSPTIQKVALPVVSLTFMFFFFFQGPLIFGESWGRWEILVLAFAALAGLSIPLNPALHSIEAWKVLAWFGVALAGGLALFVSVFSQFKYDTGFPVGDAWAMVLFQIFVVAYTEEVFFRGVLAERLRAIPSAAIFSLFHLTAYSVAGLNFGAFFTAFVFGLLFAVIYFATKERAGIGATWGLHAAWNLALLFA